MVRIIRVDLVSCPPPGLFRYTSMNSLHEVVEHLAPNPQIDPLPGAIPSDQIRRPELPPRPLWWVEMWVSGRPPVLAAALPPGQAAETKPNLWAPVAQRPPPRPVSWAFTGGAAPGA